MLCNAYDDMSNFSARSKHQRCYSCHPLDYVVLGGRPPELMVTHDRAWHWSRSSRTRGRRWWTATSAIATCVTPDLLLEDPNETFAAYV
jgi:hypothetical protein